MGLGPSRAGRVIAGLPDYLGSNTNAHIKHAFTFISGALGQPHFSPALGYDVLNL